MNYGMKAQILKFFKFSLHQRLHIIVYTYFAFVRVPREFNLFLQTQLEWNQRKLVKSNGLSRVLMMN